MLSIFDSLEQLSDAELAIAVSEADLFIHQNQRNIDGVLERLTKNRFEKTHDKFLKFTSLSVYTQAAKRFKEIVEASQM